MTIRGQAPALARITELSLDLESLQIIHESFLLLPGQLKQFAVEQRQPFCEILRWYHNLLQDVAGFQFDLPQRGLAIQTSALEELTVEKHQALRERTPIVREDVDDIVSINRRFIRSCFCF